MALSVRHPIAMTSNCSTDAGVWAGQALARLGAKWDALDCLAGTVEPEVYAGMYIRRTSGITTLPPK